MNFTNFRFRLMIKKDYFLNSVVGMKTWFYSLEILRNDRIMTKVYKAGQFLL